MKILITGAQGQLGKALQQTLTGHRLTAYGRQDLDITNKESVEAAVQVAQPDLVIHSKSGAMEGVVNFGGLIDKVDHHDSWSEKDNVLNGIAYHPERKTFFVTGKEWNKLFEVTIQKKNEGSL